MKKSRELRGYGWLIIWICSSLILFGESFSVGTFNLENYLSHTAPGRTAKTETSKAQVRQAILALKADVLALQEIGTTNALLELRDALGREGLHYPFWEHVGGYDTNIYVAVLSKFPFLQRRPHSTLSFLLNGRRFRISRGFAEVVVQVNSRYQFTLITAHLKSRRPVGYADEAEMRLEEAQLLREIIEARLSRNPDLNLVVLGDFNDLKDSKPIRTLLGKGRLALVDTRPGEQGPGKSDSLRSITWTHFYAQEDVYSRIDYIFLSRGMAREWTRAGTYVLDRPNWGEASDHRPIRASFELKGTSR